MVNMLKVTIKFVIAICVAVIIIFPVVSSIFGLLMPNLRTVSNQTGVIDQTNPIFSGIESVVQVVIAVLFFGGILIYFVVVLVKRRDDPYEP